METLTNNACWNKDSRNDKSVLLLLLNQRGVAGDTLLLSHFWDEKADGKQLEWFHLADRKIFISCDVTRPWKIDCLSRRLSKQTYAMRSSHTSSRLHNFAMALSWVNFSKQSCNKALCYVFFRYRNKSRGCCSIFLLSSLWVWQKNIMVYFSSTRLI